MKRQCVLVVVFSVVLFAGVCVRAVPYFDRSAFIEQVRVDFAPLEVLLGLGDALDYEQAVLFSGVLNGTDEHLVVVRLTSDSTSVSNAYRLREDLSWEDVGALPLFAVMVRGVTWTTGEVVDAAGVFVRDVEVTWATEVTEGVWFKFAGNMKIHLETCTTISMNQV
jgi:hypothetical protein